MFSRVLMIMCAGVLSAGVLMAPADSDARGGVAGGFHAAGGFRGPGKFHPAFVRRHLSVPIHGGFRRFFPARAALLRRHRGFWFGGFPYAVGVPVYGSYYDPSDYGHEDPSDAVGSLPPAVRFVPVTPPQPIEGHGCQSQTVTVPASGGGNADVTIVRC